ncbi:MAG TPA: thioredoxin domain-containing protein [Allosphingosinicella sp.]|nr:thioredoxin domain-containing protein [Allosphingosinicella sp.]
MKAKIAIAAAAAVLALAGCSKGGSNGGAPANKPLPQIRAPNGDWTQIVSETPQGGFRMGNPNAPVKLVEYASLSCPYCQHFDQDGVPTLRDKYVKSGEVSWEYRTYSNHPTDPAVASLVHCQGADAFFGLADQLYATQDQWFGKLVDFSQHQTQQYNQLQSLPALQRNAEIARITGLDEFFRQRGMPASRVQACLADQKVLDKVAAITDLGNKDGIGGTPNFVINGKTQPPDVADWKSLEPLLRTAIG